MNLLGPRPNVVLWSIILCGGAVVWITVMAFEWTYHKEKGKIHDTYLFNATVTSEKLQPEESRNPNQRARRDTHEYHVKLGEPFHNSFVSMHLQAAKKLNISNCWICTHAPISHKTIPLLGVPSTLAEIENSAHFEDVSRTMVDRVVSLLLFTNAPMTIPSVCINFTREYSSELLTQGFQSITRPIGNSNCMDNAEIRYWFDDKDTAWSTDRYQELHDYTHRQHSRQNNMKLLMCLQGYNFKKACAAPPGYYFICGKKAYNWIPLNSMGVCYFGRVIPATWYMSNNEFKESQIRKIPIHLLKRDLDSQSEPGGEEENHDEVEDPDMNKEGETNIEVPLVNVEENTNNIYNSDLSTNIESHDREIKPIFSIPSVNRCCIKKAFSFIIDLADLIDNNTALYDMNIVMLDTELKMVKKEMLQHRLVLDYLTASQGGICTIVGTGCCNYIGNDTKAEDAIISHVEQVQQLKLNFRKEHTETAWVEGSWESWTSWLNPANWFSGIGGWFAGILHGILYIVGIIVLIILIIKCAPMLFKCCFKVTTTSCCAIWKACTNTGSFEPQRSRVRTAHEMVARIAEGQPRAIEEV
ncbi:uncharacterized protein LOC143943102 [Lithobates pipiens]